MLRSHSSGPTIQRPEITPHQDEGFRRWLSQRHALAHVSNDAIEAVEKRSGNTFLDSYQLIVVTGSQEYISHETLDLLQRYVERGGKLYLSTTEFAFWIVRFESNGDTMLNFRVDPRDDPLRVGFPDRVASLGDIVRNIEDHFGVALSHGIGLDTGFSPSPIVVLAPHHWALAGSGLFAGDELTTTHGGYAPGAWIAGEPPKIVSADVPAAHQEIIAAGTSPALLAPWWVDSDILIDGLQNHTFPRDLPFDTVTNPVVGVLHVGAGSIFIDPAVYWRAPYDLQVAQMIDRLLDRWGAPK